MKHTLKPRPRTYRLRCAACLGMGYKGRWRSLASGRAWKIETCRSCGGRGERDYTRLTADQRREMGDGS